MRVKFTIACIALLLAGCNPPASSEPTAATTPNVAVNPPAAQIARVGVGQQGRSLDNEQGVGKIISGPASAFFNTKEKIAFEIAVPHALNLYQAEKGEYPRSHEEFMEKVIQFNRIDLPKLPPGVQYQYHPDDHQLWVEPIPTAGATNASQENQPPAGN
jgi:hypothetical protein